MSAVEDGGIARSEGFERFLSHISERPLYIV